MKKVKIIISMLIAILIVLMMQANVFAATTYDLDAEYNGENIELQWDEIGNANTYKVYINTTGSDKYIGSVKDSTNCTIINIKENTKYKIKVKGYKNSTYVGTTKTVTVETYYGDKYNPEVDSVSNLDGVYQDGKIHLKWDKANGATGYNVYLSTKNSSYKNLGSVSGTTATIKDVQENTTYYIKIRAYSKISGKTTYADNYSKELEIYTDEYYNDYDYDDDYYNLDRVTGLEVEATGTKAYLTWNKVSGATGYEIQLENTSIGTKKYTTTSTSRTITGITSSSYYYVKVRAYKTVNGSKKYGSYSTELKFKKNSGNSSDDYDYDDDYDNYDEADLDKVTGLEVSVSGTKAYLEWDRVSGAKGYEIRLEDSRYTGARITSTSSTSVTINDVSAKSYYSVKVRAYVLDRNGKKMYGPYSKSVKLSTANKTEEANLRKVTGLKYTKNGSTVTLTWNAISGVAGYQIELVVPGVTTATKYSTTNTITISGLIKRADKYKVRVRAYNPYTGEYGEYSDYKLFY